MKQVPSLQPIYKQWCVETKRNGGVLVGSSIKEFLLYLETKLKQLSDQENQIKTEQVGK